MKRHHHNNDSSTDSTLRLDPTTTSILRKFSVTPENLDFSDISCEEFGDSIDQHMSELGLSPQVEDLDWSFDMSTNVDKGPQLPLLPPVFQKENQWFAASVNDERFTYMLSQKLFTEKLSVVDTPTSARNVLEVAMLWRGNLVNVSHFKAPKDVFVGTSIKNDFRAPTPTESNRFCLLSKSEETFTLNIRSSMKIAIQDSTLEVGDFCWYRHKHSDHVRSSNGHLSIDMDLHDRICVGWNDITFIIQYVAPARVIGTSLLKSLDYYFTKVMSLSFIGHSFFLVALLLTPLAPKSLESELFSHTDRFAQIIIKPEKIRPKPKKSFTINLRKSSAPKGTTTHKFTANKKKIKRIKSQSTSAPDVDVHKRSRDLAFAKKSGIFKALGGAKLAGATVFGNEGLSRRLNDALGSLNSRNTALLSADATLGTRGSQSGNAHGTLGIGSLGISKSGQSSIGFGSRLGSRGKNRLSVTTGKTKASGCLQSEVVQRVLKRVTNQAKYCYEKELPRNPGLSGKIITAFVIDATGKVQVVDIEDSTMGNSQVENCLKRVIQRLRFPPCRGGGIADVTYPWIFKSSSL